MKIAHRLAPLAALLCIGAGAPPAAEEAAANRIRGHIEFLASDLLEGRDTGSRGYDIAAEYVASQFRALGLRPAGKNGGWLVDVPFREATHDGEPKVGIVRGGKTEALRNGEDFALSPSINEKNRKLDAPLVFVGYGLREPLLKIDDYAGQDVRGKIVVALEGTPDGLPTEIAAHLGSAKGDTAVKAGAVGFVEIPKGTEKSRGFQFLERPRTDWIDAQGGGRSKRNPVVSMSVSAGTAERLFAGAKRSLAQIRAAAQAKRPLGAFPLSARLTIDANSAWRDFSSPEVVGLLPGSDPKLAGEYVVLMGHLDHLGIKKDAKPGEDAIRNGALDNAAGVATMLEAAREFVDSGKAPRRSVLFIANTAEERGLLGADYYANNPTVPIQSIVGLVDLDMPLLLYDFTDIVAFGAEHSTVARTVAKAAAEMNVAVSKDPFPEESIFTRSDHYNFVRQGVPAILLFTGFANGGEKIWKHWLPTIYHTPQDDLKQAINWRAGARYAELNYRISRALADDDQRPLWYEGDYFGDRFAPGQPRAKR